MSAQILSISTHLLQNNTKHMNTLRICIAASTFALFCGTASAAVITNPTVTTGTNVIAPSAGININASGSTSQATIEALTDISALQSFAGFTNSDNVMAFTAAERVHADVQFVTDVSTGEIVNNSWSTSYSSAVRLNFAELDGIPESYFMDINLGEWDSVASTFNVGAYTVGAAAFTLTGPDNRTEGFSSIEAEFFSASNAVLSTQTITNAALVGNVGTDRMYFGYQATGGDTIARIKITFTTNNTISTTAPILGLDDFATTTAIPESGFAGLGLGLLALSLLSLRRRSRK